MAESMNGIFFLAVLILSGLKYVEGVSFNSSVCPTSVAAGDIVMATCTYRTNGTVCPSPVAVVTMKVVDKNDSTLIACSPLPTYPPQSCAAPSGSAVGTCGCLSKSMTQDNEMVTYYYKFRVRGSTVHQRFSCFLGCIIGTPQTGTCRIQFEQTTVPRTATMTAGTTAPTTPTATFTDTTPTVMSGAASLRPSDQWSFNTVTVFHNTVTVGLFNSLSTVVRM